MATTVTPIQKKKIFAVCFVVGMVGGYYYYQSIQKVPENSATTAPTDTGQTANVVVTMADVLDIARTGQG